MTPRARAKVATTTNTRFTPTKGASAEDKAKFAAHFVRFVESGFKTTLFYDWFYRRLSSTFGHIAHYDRGGFYAEWFSTTAGKRNFLRRTREVTTYGDPTFTFSDVERYLQQHPAVAAALDEWSRRLADEVEARERAELARLKARYESTVPS